jgi:hypothetical protein
MEVSGQLYTLTALPPEKEASVPIRIGDWVGSRGGEEQKNLLPLPGIEPKFLGLPTSSLVSISNEKSFTECYKEFSVFQFL